MLTESEIKLARYKETAKEVDDLGRIIEVRRLRPSEHTRVSGMTAELTGYDEGRTPDGDVIRLSHRTPLVLASAVCRINDDFIPFPRSRSELDAIYDRLDTEGIIAAGKAFARLQGIGTEPEETEEDKAKNL